MTAHAPWGRGAPKGMEATFAQQASCFRKACPLPQMEHIYAEDDSGLQKDARLAEVAAADSAGSQGGTLPGPSRTPPRCRERPWAIRDTGEV